MTVRIKVGDCIERLRGMPDESVHCVVTSPPFFGLRNYGVDGQIGLEESIDAHVEKLVEVFREVRRVLRDDGTLWMEYGDMYDAKQLVGAPWRVAFALKNDGWFLRSDIVWHRPNPMPESVSDRPTKSHSYIFLLTKSPRYYFDADAVREENSETSHTGGQYQNEWKYAPLKSGTEKSGMRIGVPIPRNGRNIRDVWTIATHSFPGAHFATFPPKIVEPCIKAGTSERGCCAECGAPWERETDVTYAAGGGGGGSSSTSVSGSIDISIDSSRMPERKTKSVTTTGWRPTCDHDETKLARCVVLDPFGGAGTTALVADRLQRDAILIELNPEYAEMARKRIYDECPMLVDVAIDS